MGNHMPTNPHSHDDRGRRATPSWAGHDGCTDRSLPRDPPGERSNARHLARRGVDAAPPRSATLRAARSRDLAQVGSVEPDGLVQGSGHDRGRLEGGRGRCRGGDLCLDGKHGRFGRCLRRSSRNPGRRAHAGGRGRGRQGVADADVRREGSRGPGRLRRGPRRSAGALPARHACPRELRQPVSPRGTEDRCLRDRRGAGRGARRVRDPIRGGGNTSAYAIAIGELGIATPIYSVEAEHRPTTLASAIRIGDPVHAASVQAAGANVVTVSDDEIVAAWLELATTEGLFCEPSSAAGLAAIRRGAVPGERVVVTITGHGLKDTEAADRYAPPLAQVDADPDAIAAAARA